MRTWLAAIGLFSMLGQVVLLRELHVAFYGSELIYVLALGCWMVLTAVGAGASRFVPSPGRVRALLLALSLTTLVALVLARLARPVLSDVPGAYLPLPLQLAAMVLILAPVSILLGLAFQWAARLYAEHGHVATAYAIESAGALAGGALATLLLLAGVPNLTLGLLGALATALVALHPWRQRPRWWWLVGPCALVLVVAVANSVTLDTWLTGLSHANVRATRDTAYGRVTVRADGELVTMFENDALAIDSQGTGASELTHVAALQRQRVERVLILGGGLEGSVAAALAHHPERIDYIELNGALVELGAEHLPERTRDALAAATVHTVITDPRDYLRREHSPYDLILIGAPEPASGLSNRYYTREMFARCAANLAGDGILALRLPAGDNLLGHHHRRRLASIQRALAAELADVVVLPGSAHLLLASDAPLESDAGVLAQRLEARDLHARLVSGPYLHYLYENDRFDALAAALAHTDVPANTDTRPVCYQHTLMIWLSKFYPALASIQSDPTDLSPLTWGLAAAAFVVGLVLARRSRRARAPTRVAIAGFAGMALETAIILAYQSSRGALFGDLGLLLTAFMAGMTVAAALIGRARTLPRASDVAALIGLTATAVVVAAILAFTDLGLPVASLCLFGAGATVAAVFAEATRAARDEAAALSPLYAADLAGGALGSIAASLLLVPWLGLWGLALLAAGISLASLSLAK